MRVDLEGVVVVCGVLKQAVKGIEHLVGKEEEEFTVSILVSRLDPR